MASDAPPPLAELGRSKAFWRWLAGLAVSSITLAAPFAWAWATSRASESYVQLAIGDKNKASELDKNRLHALERRVAALNTRVASTELDLKEHQKWLYHEIWMRVGLQAADAEPNPRKRALAAREARQQFERLSAGRDLEEAANMALATPPPR